MRPSILYPLFANLLSLRGIGPRMAVLYKKLCGEYIIDVLWHLPSGSIDRSYAPRLRDAEAGRVATLCVEILEHLPPPKRGRPYRIRAQDGAEQLTIIHFNANDDYLRELYPVHQKIVLSGTLDKYRGSWVMNHPDYAVSPERASEIPPFEPVYPMTAGISGKMLAKTVSQALEKVPSLPEWSDKHLIARHAWPGWRDALFKAHTPRANEVAAEEQDIRHLRRLAYDELLADQLSLAIIRAHHKTAPGRALRGSGELTSKLRTFLPFALTPGQKFAIAEISADLASAQPMLRLLQGDVGAGKTVVALMAMLQAVEAGSQAALMAPTEILAKQHHAKLSELLQPLGVQTGLLVGQGRGSGRDETLTALANGTLKLVVGTHALFQHDVVFSNLGLAVIDEQHRFGVNQRLLLSEKGRGVDILAMTATPIPRTLTLTAYGDMDVSRLTDKPIGRQKIETSLIDQHRLSDVIDGVKRQIERNAQVYWVCPLVDESELLDLAAATARATLLKEILGDGVVGLVHGKMRAREKDAVMRDFASGALRLLVATTVIEVGVDVPTATIMVVEHAERFGLAQLHQLRGRVGRGSGQSHCLLVYMAPVGQMARARLKTLKETEDGFFIAEEDLRLRGAGEVLGLKQSGGREFRLADLTRDKDLLEVAHDDAAAILRLDPSLASERGNALRILLYLFNRDAAVPLLRAG